MILVAENPHFMVIKMLNGVAMRPPKGATEREEE